MSVFCSFRLLQSKPEAARKALSENSLLKNIDFNEKFLGEENVTESKMSLFLLFNELTNSGLYPVVSSPKLLYLMLYTLR